ncbi:HAD domain-containing protein [Paraburkholderia sp. ZP32-5]|uniref:HAD domain-containing protein n=1 Tax=Paraburkholderia sp. ZP32-5 TaxID=2883245 RepID=UPI001EEC80F4|nr:HAD domain-containing protein [Paraburkholderia sp. ZP32-5]
MSDRQVLFLDYDGVLHRGGAYRTKRGIISSDPTHIKLFEYADVLAAILAPYPSVELVLSTSWVKGLGFNRARSALPAADLRAKVVWATYHSRFHDAYFWDGMARGILVLGYVNRHRLVHWLALDDMDDGFDDEPGRPVHCDPDEGLGDPDIQEGLKAALYAQFGEMR